MSKYREELDALQRWIYGAANLPSFNLKEAPAKLGRPVILFEPPLRGKDRNIGRYAYINRVQQYGKLYVVSVEQAADYQENILADLEEKTGVLPVYDSASEERVTYLKSTEIEFRQTENLDIPFVITYEVAYARTRPDPVPHATTVENRLTDFEP